MQTTLATAGDPILQAATVLQTEIGAASSELGAAKARAGANIHGARKHLKRARATLRLLRDAIGRDAYRRENVTLRDAARPLSVVRDSEMLLDALDGVVKRFGDAAASLPLGKLRTTLRKQLSVLRNAGVKRSRLAQIQKMLSLASERAHRWRFDAMGWPTLSNGLRRVYRKGRIALNATRSSATTETLHEWRKQTKYLWHQLQLLEPLAPDVLGELADQFHTLSDYLGDDHDLAVLRGQAFAGANGMDEQSAAALKALIDRQRAELQGKALALGERLYADKPKVVAQRLDAYWVEWARLPRAVGNDAAMNRH